MRKIENITNVLKFYMAVNKLKETTKGEKAVVLITFLEVLS